MQRIRSTMDLGTLVRQTRKNLGLSQSELALAAGVGLRFMVDLEAGKQTVQLGKVFAVLDALGVDVLASESGAGDE